MAQQLFSLGGLAAEKYDGTGKIEMLRRAFGNIKMRDLVHGIAIPSLRLNAAQSSRSAAGDFDDGTFGENVRDDQGLLKSALQWASPFLSLFLSLSLSLSLSLDPPSPPSPTLPSHHHPPTPSHLTPDRVQPKSVDKCGEIRLLR